jgi:hypothetical protein
MTIRIQIQLKCDTCGEWGELVDVSPAIMGKPLERWPGNVKHVTPSYAGWIERDGRETCWTCVRALMSVVDARHTGPRCEAVLNLAVPPATGYDLRCTSAPHETGSHGHPLFLSWDARESG